MRGFALQTNIVILTLILLMILIKHMTIHMTVIFPILLLELNALDLLTQEKMVIYVNMIINVMPKIGRSDVYIYKSMVMSNLLLVQKKIGVGRHHIGAPLLLRLSVKLSKTLFL